MPEPRPISTAAAGAQQQEGIGPLEVILTLPRQQGEREKQVFDSPRSDISDQFRCYGTIPDRAAVPPPPTIVRRSMMTTPYKIQPPGVSCTRCDTQVHGFFVVAFHGRPMNSSAQPFRWWEKENKRENRRKQRREQDKIYRATQYNPKKRRGVLASILPRHTAFFGIEPKSPRYARISLKWQNPNDRKRESVRDGLVGGRTDVSHRGVQPAPPKYILLQLPPSPPPQHVCRSDGFISQQLVFVYSLWLCPTDGVLRTGV